MLSNDTTLMQIQSGRTVLKYKLITNSGGGPHQSYPISVSDPYSFFTDPDPEDPDGGQYPDPGL